MRQLLLVGAEGHQRGTKNVDRDTEAADRHVIARSFFEEDPLMVQGQTLTSVLHREGETGIAGVIQLLLEGFDLGEPFRARIVVLRVPAAPPGASAAGGGRR